MQAIIGALRAVLGLDTLAFERGSTEAAKTLSRLEKRFDQFNRNVSGAVNTVGRSFAALGVGLSVGALVAYRKQLGEMASDLKDNADRLGVSTDALQGYEYAALRAGVKQEDLNKSLEFFNRKIGEAMDGNKQTIDEFERLGVKILDVNGKLRPFDVILREVAARIVNLATASERAKASQDFFSKSGQNTLLMLQDLARSSEDLTNQAMAAGQVIGGPVLKHLDELQKKARELESRWRVLTATLVMEFEVAALQRLEEKIESTKREIAALGEAWNWLKRQLQPSGTTDPDGEKARQRDVDRIAKLEEEIQKWRDYADRTDNPMKRAEAVGRIIALEQDIARIREAGAAREAAIRAGAAAGAAVGGTVPQGRGAAPLTEPPPGTVTTAGGARNPPPRVTGGGGQSPEERARQNIAAWRQEMEDFRRTLQGLEADTTAPLDEVEKRLESQRRLTERIRQGVKGLPENSPVVQQIKDQAAATEQARLAYELYAKAARDADQAERQFGDGAMELAERQRELNLALATGRLSQQAYTIAMQEATKAAEQQRLRMIGLADEGFGGAVAGIRSAALAFDESNGSFALGQRVFGDIQQELEATGMAALRLSLDWRQSLTNMIKILSEFALKMFVFKPLMSGLGGLFGGGSGGGLLGLLGLGASAAGGIGSSGQRFGGIENFGGARAGGGRVNPWSWYMVGERGPEPFMPDQPGRIMSNSELRAAMGHGDSWSQAQPPAVNQTVNITTRDYDSFKHSERQLSRLARRRLGMAGA